MSRRDTSLHGEDQVGRSFEEEHEEELGNRDDDGGAADADAGEGHGEPCRNNERQLEYKDQNRTVDEEEEEVQQPVANLSPPAASTTVVAEAVAIPIGEAGNDEQGLDERIERIERIERLVQREMEERLQQEGLYFLRQVREHLFAKVV